MRILNRSIVKFSLVAATFLLFVGLQALGADESQKPILLLDAGKYPITLTDKMLRTHGKMHVSFYQGIHSDLVVIPVTVLTDGTPDPYSILYRTLNVLGSAHPDKIPVHHVGRYKTSTGELDLTDSNLRNVALSFLTGAVNALVAKNNSIFVMPGISEPVYQYLKVFFPNTAMQSRLFSLAVLESRIKNMVVSKDQGILDLSLIQIQRTALLMSGYSELLDSGRLHSQGIAAEKFETAIDEALSETALAIKKLLRKQAARPQLERAYVELLRIALFEYSNPKYKDHYLRLLTKRIEKAELLRDFSFLRALKTRKLNVAHVSAVYGLFSLIFGSAADMYSSLLMIGLFEAHVEMDRTKGQHESSIYSSVCRTQIAGLL